MSIKALTRKVGQIERKARQKRGEVEFEVYLEGEEPEGWEPDYVIDFGLGSLEDDEDDEEL